MDVERSLLSRAIYGGQVDLLVSRGISRHHFAREADGSESENARVFQFLVDHLSHYGSPPSREAVLAASSDFRMVVSEDALDYLLDEFIRQVKRRETQRALIEVAEKVDSRDEQLDLEDALFEAASRVATVVPGSRVSYLSEAPKRLELYREVLRTGKLPGVPIGYPTIDNSLLGIQKYEVLTVAAFSSAGKSVTLQNIALSSYLTDPEQRPLIISLEMDEEALWRRFDAMGAKIRANAIKGLEVAESSEEMRRWEQWAEHTTRAPNNIMIIDDIGDCTIERVLAENVRYKPTATFIDYVNMMVGPGDNSYMRVGNAIKGLKQIARRLKIPQFTAAQTTRAAARDGVQEDNVADSIEIFRTTDIMLGIDRSDEMDQRGEALLKIVKNRDGYRNVECRIKFDWSTMDFGEIDGFGSRGRQNGQNGSTPPDVDLSSNPFMQQSPNPFMT